MRDAKTRYFPKAYDFHRSSESEWWVVLSQEKYRFAKFSFWTEKEFIHCGYYVEKGYGSGEGNSSLHEQMMDKSWDWHEFSASMINGEIDSLLKQFSFPIHIILTDGGLGGNLNRIEFALENGKLKFQNTSHQIDTSFEDLKNCSSFIDIAMVLQNEKWQEYWINFYIHTPFLPDESGWDADDISRNFLMHFEKWINKPKKKIK
ncbi:hypothetical protein OMP38_03155 [Cohnella ginsengisoli]|uniref:Uncharacterized protein n=1 Tax=Cohnella ginsengisoli TaxID=425004 RepID=A0A9X4KDT4_9BACL|nr:hypothetical protein [Cohnella ginsengisoli]MDG0789961.1 hypothetical protein [Cohnella ginsengisoli]